MATLQTEGDGSPGEVGGPDPSYPTADLDDYLKEIDAIEQASKDTEDTSEEEPKTPDEGEQEVAWLTDAGYAHLVSKLEEGRELEDEMLSKETASLTRTQAAAVKRRVETLNATIREKHRNQQKKANRRDVRRIFDLPTESELTDPENRSTSGSKVTRRATKRPDHGGSFLKRTGGYSISRGYMNDEPDSKGIETISIQSKGAPESRPAPTNSLSSGNSSPGAETEVSPTFSIDTTKPRESILDGGLPNMVLQRDTLGVTRVMDLSKADTERVRALALIELTALFDTNGITYTRHKSKKRLKDHGVFGVPLSALIDHDQKKYPSIIVPKIFLELVTFVERHGIKEEGILRVPGSQTRIKALRVEIEAKFNADKFQWEENVMPNDAAGLLKQFIRELPTPLLTFEYLDAFAQVERVQDWTQKVQALNLLVLLLPDVHRNTLHMLLSFLKKVVVNEENLMNLHNVSMIMAPNLFLVASAHRKKTGLKEAEIRMAAGTSNIVRMLIKYQDILWTIPSFMITQIRQKYEVDQVRKFREKPIMKLLGRKEKAETYRKPAIHQEADYQEGVIRVLCPHVNKYLTPIQLDSTTTANDVVNKFRRRTVAHPPSAEHANGKFSSQNDRQHSVKGELPHDELYLYEVGGNIGERRLDPNTQMLALLRVNPNAEWIIQLKREGVPGAY